MTTRILSITAFLFLTFSLVTGCSPNYPPLTESQIAKVLQAFEPPNELVKLSNRPDAKFREAYAGIERYTPKYPSVSSTCQAVSEFSRVAQYAQGGNSWKQYMPSDLRGFDLIGGKHYGLATDSGADAFASVGMDISVLSFESASEAEEFASLIRDNVESCFDFPKTSMPVTGLDLDVLSHASTLIQSDLDMEGGGFTFEVVEDTYLELSKIAGILDDSIVKENKIVEVNQYGANLVVLVATSSSKADSVLGISAFTIGEQFHQIRENLGPLLRQASND